MRKTMLILLGLLLIAGAFGAFAYRYLERDSGERAAWSAPSDARERGFERRAFSRPEAGERSGRSGQRGSWRYLDMTLNLLNLVVGVVGIWLTITGARMQRQAMAMHAEQQKSRSKT